MFQILTCFPLTCFFLPGIAGLAAAYALAASGHRVRVLEQAQGLQFRPGGLRLPPNATRILSYWGVEKEIAQKASAATSSSIMDSECPGIYYFCRLPGYRGPNNTDQPGFLAL
jgi:2-polyprenyl-6-methoxyphenol hydroxylase-like FAD-dependent oxidoreductase